MSTNQILTRKNERQRSKRAPARPDQLAYTVAQVQEIGGPGRTKVYKLVAEGKLTLIHVGGSSRITGASLMGLPDVLAQLTQDCEKHTNVAIHNRCNAEFKW